MADTYFSKREIQNILFETGIEEKQEWNDKRTYRKILRMKRTEEGKYHDLEMATVDDTQTKHQKVWYGHKKKMPAYIKKGGGWTPKYERENKGYRKSGFPNTSKRHKEMINNANRSMKKTVRQQYKKELRIELKNLNEYDTNRGVKIEKTFDF